MKLHDSRDHFMMIRDTSLKDALIKLVLTFASKRVMQIGFFEFLKQVGSVFTSESANEFKHSLRIG